MDPLKEAILALKAGRPVVLTDDADRENEADLIMPADCITESWMAFFIRHCSGIVCLCLTDEKLQSLKIPPMVEENSSRYGTAFTVSIEACTGVTTGVSAADRVTTIQCAVAANAKPEDLARPGHVFPLRATPGGVLARRGHTEGSVELATLAGFQPAAVLCELMNDNGTMMRGKALHAFAQTHDLPIISIAELVDTILRRV